MVRLTKQKRLFNQVVETTSSFFDAYAIEEKLKVQKTPISLATIYRLLKLMEEEGLLHSFSCNERTIYSKNKNNHIHFTCEKCATITHIVGKNVDFLSDIKEGEICHFQIDIKGICKKCSKKKEL